MYVVGTDLGRKRLIVSTCPQFQPSNSLLQVGVKCLMIGKSRIMAKCSNFAHGNSLVGKPESYSPQAGANICVVFVKRMQGLVKKYMRNFVGP